MSEGSMNPDRRGAQPLWRGLVGLALAAAAVTAGQAVWVWNTGEELCLGGGCAVVGSLTRIPPAWFNLAGTGAFLGVALLAWWGRAPERRRVRTLLHAVLASLLAAEGVLFAYQIHVAGAWCTYCLGILAIIVLLNLCYSRAGTVFGAGAFVATASIFSMLSFVPAVGSLEQGTFATVTRPTGPSLTLLVSEDCSHCQEVEEALAAADRCSVAFNPVGPVSADFLPGTQERQEYDPRFNLALARLLGIDTVPILVTREGGRLQVLTGSSTILDFVVRNCAEPPAPAPGDPILDPWGGGGSELLLVPQDDGCGLAVDCD